ncbi:hypothetical protein Tco_0404889 [Tanacetum coccineum]
MKARTFSSWINVLDAARTVHYKVIEQPMARSGIGLEDVQLVIIQTLCFHMYLRWRVSSHKTSLERHEEQIETILNHLDELPLKRIEHMEDKIESLESNGHDDEIFLLASGSSTLEILTRISAFATDQICRCDVSYLYVSSVVAALEAQAATMANTDNTNRNTGPRETHVARKCSYKEFMSCQPFNFKGTEGAVGLIHWFIQTEFVFSHNNCTEDCKVKFATGTLTEEALS